MARIISYASLIPRDAGYIVGIIIFCYLIDDYGPQLHHRGGGKPAHINGKIEDVSSILLWFLR